MTPGTPVRVKLPNGYESTGVIVRQFKNGCYGVREAGGRYHVRTAESVAALPAPAKRKGK